MRWIRGIAISFLLTVTQFSSTRALAQDSSNKITKPIFLHGSFYYDFPKSIGASAGIDFPFNTILKLKTSKTGKERITHRDWILTADIGFYRNRFNNSGLLLVPSIGRRHYREGPYYFEWQAGAGLVRTFYDGIVYSVDDNNKVTEKEFFGRFYASANIATVFGWNFENGKRIRPFAIQVKPVLWFQFPYNSFTLPHLSLEAGIKYHFKKFNLLVRQKKVNTK